MSDGTLTTAPATILPNPWQRGPLKAAPSTSPGRGRGLFATAPIATGEVIERACSVRLTSEQCDRLESILPLGDFYFRHPEDAEQGIVVLGLTSLVNHAEDPNAGVRFLHCGDLGWIAELVCMHPIPTGEEITYRYRCAPWFDVG